MHANTSGELDSVHPAVLVSLSSVLIVATAITIVGNIMIIILVLRTPALRKPVFILTTNISMADLLFLVFVLPQYIAALIMNSTSSPFGTGLCYVQVYASNGTIATTVYFMAATAVCRTLHVCYPSINTKLCKPLWMMVFFAIFWILPLIVCALSDTGVRYDRTKFICVFISRKYLYVLGGIVYAPSLIIMLLAYIKILHFIRQARRRVVANIAAGTIQTQKDRHVFKLVVAIMVIFVISNTIPSVFYSLSHWYDKHITDLIGSWLGRLRPYINLIAILITCTYLRDMIWNYVWCCSRPQI